MLRPGGVLLLIEATAPDAGSEDWISRSVETYQNSFSELRLSIADEYSDRGEKSSVLVGRRAG